jgi:hypothetical protein
MVGLSLTLQAVAANFAKPAELLRKAWRDAAPKGDGHHSLGHPPNSRCSFWMALEQHISWAYGRPGRSATANAWQATWLASQIQIYRD